MIEDYALNPEAIKQIAYRIKHLETSELTKLYEQQSGEIAFILESELRSRGISTNLKEVMSPYEQFFIDEAKLFDKFRCGRTQEGRDLSIPKISSEYAK